MSVTDDFLPEFNTVTSVSATNAMVDRFELEIGDFALIGDEDDICYVLNHLSHHTIPTAYARDVRLFNSGNLQNLRSRIDIRFSDAGTGPGQFRPRPIIAGGIKRVGFRSGRRSTARISGERVRVSLKAWLNLTRFVQAQRFRRPSRPRNPVLARPLVLAIDPQRSWFEKERPLLPADNLLIGSPHAVGFARRHSIPDLMRMYLNAVEAEAIGLLVNQMSENSVQVQADPYQSLQALEVYWEFSDNDPIGLVERLCQPLYALSSHIRVTNHDAENVEEETFNQSKCVTVDLAGGTRLRVYAKTTRRVRFEIEFSGKAIGLICSGQTASNTEDVLAKVEVLVDRAILHMNWVLERLRYEVPMGVRQESVVGLISKIARTMENTAMTEMAVSSLHTFGRIAPEGNELMLEAAHALRRAGVLRTVGRRSLYVPTDTYVDATRALMAMS